LPCVYTAGTTGSGTAFELADEEVTAMSTIQVDRRFDQDDVRTVTAPPAEVTIPDHVPNAWAAEHPDAAAVVARPTDRHGGVRAIGRPARRSAARSVMALAGCLALAGVFAGGEASSSAPQPAANPPAVTVVHPAPAASPVLAPSCRPASPWVLGACAAARR
jgi:hypothetical protein